MKRFMALCLVLASSVGVLGTTCGQADNRAEAAPPDEASEDETDDEAGRTCRRDADCSSYLRCFDQECIVPPAVTGQRRDGTPRLHIHAAPDADDPDERIASFSVELATTARERARGLMYRKKMASQWGMLFIYPGEKQRSFWMKDTYIPLDMIFISAEGRIVHIIESAEPLTRTSRRSRRPARYVLELNGGAAEQYGLRVGQRMRLDNVPARFRPD